MTTTDTERETETPPQGIDLFRCSICGELMAEKLYARNTCSQDCARTAAIVEAIDRWRTAAVPAIFDLTPLGE